VSGRRGTRTTKVAGERMTRKRIVEWIRASFGFRLVMTVVDLRQCSDNCAGSRNENGPRL